MSAALLASSAAWSAMPGPAARDDAKRGGGAFLGRWAGRCPKIALDPVRRLYVGRVRPDCAPPVCFVIERLGGLDRVVAFSVRDKMLGIL